MEENFRAFIDAFRTIVGISKNHIEKMLKDQVDTLRKILTVLREVRENGKTIHIIGMGRSRLAGMLIGELLKNLGYKTSVIGDILSKPVRKNDVVIAVSASGWTTTTCMVVEEAIKLGAKIIALTASPGSKIDRLADISLYLPGKPSTSDLSYIVRQLIGKHKTPLTPMGTIPELNTILVGIGLTKLLSDGNNELERFREATFLILDNTQRSLRELMKNEKELERFIELVSIGVKRETPRIFFIGTGISKIIALMSALRFQHLGLNVMSIEDWKFRKKNDILIAISSSGESAYTLLYANEAKRSRMHLIALTTNPESTLAKLADIKLILTDISVREDYIKLRIRDRRIKTFIPGFEYAALVTLECIVAQLAEIHEIAEEEMRNMHANIE